MDVVGCSTSQKNSVIQASRISKALRIPLESDDLPKRGKSWKKKIQTPRK
jgi:hypothetical protein